MNVKKLCKNVTVVQTVMTGVQGVNLIGIVMIKKNRLYYCDYYCEDSGLYSEKIVLSLHDEDEVNYDTCTDYTYDGCLYDLIDVLMNNEVKTVLTTDLIEIDEE